jgi:hypothetical protein
MHDIVGIIRDLFVTSYTLDMTVVLIIIVLRMAYRFGGKKHGKVYGESKGIRHA